jgi:hypothetical protein
LIHEQLLERPFLDVSCFVLLEMEDVLNGTGKDGAFSFFTSAIGDDTGELFDAKVDIPAATALDLFL